MCRSRALRAVLGPGCRGLVSRNISPKSRPLANDDSSLSPSCIYHSIFCSHTTCSVQEKREARWGAAALFYCCKGTCWLAGRAPRVLQGKLLNSAGRLGCYLPNTVLTTNRKLSREDAQQFTSPPKPPIFHVSFILPALERKTALDLDLHCGRQALSNCDKLGWTAVYSLSAGYHGMHTAGIAFFFAA